MTVLRNASTNRKAPTELLSVPIVRLSKHVVEIRETL